MALHYVAGFVVVFIFNSLLDGLIYEYYLEAVGWFLDLRWYWQVPVFLFTTTFGVFFVFWGLGGRPCIPIFCTLRIHEGY